MKEFAPVIFKIREVNDDLVAALSQTLTIPLVSARVLVARGITTEAEAQRYLRKSLQDLVDPSHLHGVERAAERLAKARQGHETILVHGDYDADGITGAALLTLFFRAVGIRAEPFIPDRLSEGHGISPRALDRAKEIGAKLLVTCDCGISSAEGVKRLWQSGIETIVTDHHQIPDDLPQSAILVNPKLSKTSLQTHQDLSGVGVAFMLIVALRAKLRADGVFDTQPEPNLREYLDFVALGTLADMAPLTDQNRILVAWGLTQIALSNRVGIIALKEKAGIKNEWIDAQDVGFRLAPRINAAARLGHAQEALDLLLTSNYDEANSLAEQMELHNGERKALQAQMTRRASLEAERQIENGAQAIVVASKEFHPGVNGLVAQNLTKLFGVPAFVFLIEGERLRGSARSIPGVDLLEAMRSTADLFENFGGHREAGGGTIPMSALDAFRRRFDEAIRSQRVAAAREFWIDAELGLGQLNEEVISSLDQFRPFGIGNPEPRFLARARVVGSPRTIGTEHVRVMLRDDSGRTMTGVGWGMLQTFGKALRDRVEVVYTPEENVWNGRREIQIRMAAVRSV